MNEIQSSIASHGIFAINGHVALIRMRELSVLTKPFHALRSCRRGVAKWSKEMRRSVIVAVVGILSSLVGCSGVGDTGARTDSPSNGKTDSVSSSTESPILITIRALGQDGRIDLEIRNNTDFEVQVTESSIWTIMRSATWHDPAKSPVDTLAVFSVDSKDPLLALSARHDNVTRDFIHVAARRTKFYSFQPEQTWHVSPRIAGAQEGDVIICNYKGWLNSAGLVQSPFLPVNTTVLLANVNGAWIAQDR